MSGLLDDENLLYQVAELYYEQRKNQKEIADRFGVTAMTVSRILTAAREKGIVTIAIKRKFARDEALEKRIEKAFGLRRAIVVEAKTDSYYRLLPAAAAHYFQSCIHNNMAIGIGVGPTVLDIVDSMYRQRFQNVDVVQLAGGFQERKDIFSHDVVNNLSRKLGGRENYYQSPFLFKTKSLRDAFFQEVKNSPIGEVWRRCSLALIAAHPTKTLSVLVESGVIQRAEIKEMLRLGAVTDVLGHFIDKDGSPIRHEINDRVASPPLAYLRNIENVIVVGRHAGRASALVAVMRTGIAKSIITDSIAARTILEHANKKV